jgi:hypothetical protein
MIKEQFHLLDKYEQHYAITLEVTDAVRHHPLYSEFRKVVCRAPATKYKRVEETLEEVLNRMEEDG